MNNVLIHADKDLAVVYKNFNVTTLDAIKEVKEEIHIKLEKNNIGFMHPLYVLDECASGIILVILNPKIYAALNDQLQNKEIEFKYLAVVLGKTQNNVGSKSLFYKSEKNKLERVPEYMSNVLTAEFNYKLLENRDAISLMEVQTYKQETGEVRFGLAEMGTPVFGDSTYNGDKLAKNTFTALVLNKVRFTHPILSKDMLFVVEPNKEKKPWSYFESAKLSNFRG